MDYGQKKEAFEQQIWKKQKNKKPKPSNDNKKINGENDTVHT